MSTTITDRLDVIASLAVDAASLVPIKATGTTAARTLGDRAAEFANIKDFGAVGDGTTDDTAAFTLAETFSGTIIFASGTYRITTNKTLTINMLFIDGIISVDSGMTLTINGTVEAERKRIFTGSGSVVGSHTSSMYIYPEWFGAVADGLAVSPTNSTTAVQAALDYSTLHSIYFSGVYAVTGISTVSDGISFVAPHCPPSKNNNAIAGLSAYGDQAYVLRIGDGTGTAQEAAAVGWSGITFDGRDKTITSALLVTDNLSQSHCTGVTYRKAYGAAIKTRKMEDVNFLNCQFMYLGYNAAGSDTGILILDQPLDDSVYNNIIRFSGCRFEFFDGGILRFADASLSAINGLFISDCKIEVGTSGVYGSHAINYGIIHLLQDSHSYQCTDIYITDNWIARIELAASILRLSNFETIVFEGNQLSGNGASAKLFNIQTTALGITTGKGFKFKNNTYRDFNNSGTMSFTHTYKSTYQADFDYPIMFGYRAPQLYRDRVDGVLEAQLYARNAVLVADPDSADPCNTLLGVVPAVSGANTNIMLNLGASVGIPKISGLKSKSQGLVRLRVRCKKAGSTAAAILGIYIDGGTTLLKTFTIPSYYWETVEVFLNLRETYSTEAGIFFINSGSNNAAHTIYVDTVQISWVDYVKSAATPTTQTWDDGDKIHYTDAVSGSYLGEICTTAGTFGTLSAVTANTTNLSNIIVVNSSSNIRVGMYLTTAAGGFTAAKVLNVNGTSVTLNANASSDQTATSVSYAVPVFKTFSAIS